MAALTPRVVQTARGPVEVAEAGDGPALLVAHGMPGDWRQARLLAEDLAGPARVLLVTRPGYGRTPLSSGRSAVEQAALYRALLDALDIPEVVVLGISGGGPSSYAFAAGHADRCAGLVLCCAVRGGMLEPTRAMRRLAAVPGLWSALATTTRGVELLRRSPRVPDVAGCTPAEQRLLSRPRVLEAARVFAAERRSTVRGRGLRNDTRQLGAAPPAWRCGIHVPVLVMHGEQDEVVPLSHAESYAATIAGARLQVLAGLGHLVPVFARDELAAELRGLLSQ